MKTSTKLTLLFWFATFGIFSQQLPEEHSHDHDGIEHYFESKTLAAFEVHLELTESDYHNQLLIELIDDRYQLFHDEVEMRIKNGEELSDKQFQAEYNNYIEATKQLLDEAKLPLAPPVPNTPKILDGPCVNMDFETGDFTGWELTRGDVDGSVPFSYVNEFAVGPGAYHTIFGGGNDPVTGIPCVNPLGGNFSVRLGNGVGTGARGARMRQTFLVDATNYLFQYSYAVIFESPNNHTLNELPYFTVRVFDESGADVPCGEYSVIADAASAPDYETIMYGGTLVLYQDWQTVFTNLAAYIGQNVTIEFTSGDCSLTGHFGYAYVDASCNVEQLTASNDIICVGDSSTLTAPPGAASYLWSNGATTQSTVVYAGGNYTCLLTPFQGGGCELLLDIDILENPSPTADFTSNTVVGCVGDAIQFTDQSTIPPPGTIVNYRWDFGNGTVTPISNGAIVGVPNTIGTYTAPNHTYTAAGAFNVQLYVESTDGCMDSIVIPVTINDLPIVVAGIDQEVCEGVAVTLNGAGAINYAWDNGVVNGVPFVQAPGIMTYTVTGTDANGCQNTDQVDVTVNALPNVNAGVDQVVCEGVAVTLNGAGAVNYAWDNGVVNGVPFIQAPGNSTYTVIGTDLNGCQNTDQVDVTVNPLPLVNAGADQVVCEGVAVTLNGAGAVNYAWDNGIVNGVPFIQAPGNVTYTVIGTDANGCQNTDQVAVTVNPLPMVNAGADQVVCEGVAITLTGAGAVNYAWNNGALDGVPFFQAPGTITYTVIGTDANGCQNADQVDVTVNPLPIVDAGAAVEVCEGVAVTLNGSGAVNYVWDNGVVDGVPFIQAPGNNTYTVIGTDANGCQNIDEVDVSVNPLPVVTAGADQVVCEGTAVTLTGNGAVNYAWDNGVTNGVPFVPAVGTITYTVIGTDSRGCENTDQVDVIVNPLPIINAGPDQEVCEGVAVTLSGAGAVNYAWNHGVMNGVPFVQVPGSITYTVTGTDANGCQNTDQVAVVVNALPQVNAGLDQEMCDGEMVTLMANGAVNYVWDNGAVNGVPFVQGVGTIIYSVIGTDDNGCQNNDQVEVTINPLPVVSAHDIEICDGEGAVLTGQGADYYVWSGGVINDEAFYPTTSATYTVTGYFNTGCSSQATAYVTVHPSPVANFKILNLALSTTNSTTGFFNQSTGAVSYEWDFGDGSPISTEFEPTHTFPVDHPSEYAITLTAYSDYGCPARAIKYVRVFRDYLIYVPNAFTPDNNGLNEVFKPVMEGFDESGYTLYIFNRWGNLIFESHDMQVGWDGTFHDPNDRVQDGVYTWKIIAKIKDSADTKIFVGHVSLLK